MNDANNSFIGDKIYLGFVQIQKNRTKVDSSYALFFPFMGLSFVVIKIWHKQCWSSLFRCPVLMISPLYVSAITFAFIAFNAIFFCCKWTIQWTKITMGRICVDRGIEMFNRIMESLEIVWHLSSIQWAMHIPDYHRTQSFEFVCRCTTEEIFLKWP